MTLTDDIMKTEEGRRLLGQERAIITTTEMICEIMHTHDVSRDELASRLKRSKSYVTRFLNGNTASTLRDVSDVFTALGYQFLPSVGEKLA